MQNVQMKAVLLGLGFLLGLDVTKGFASNLSFEFIKDTEEGFIISLTNQSEEESTTRYIHKFNYQYRDILKTSIQYCQDYSAQTQKTWRPLTISEALELSETNLAKFPQWADRMQNRKDDRIWVYDPTQESTAECGGESNIWNIIACYAERSRGIEVDISQGNWRHSGEWSGTACITE